MTMCSTNGTNSAILPFGMKLAGQTPYLSINSPHLGLELHRAQLQEYTQRLQLGLRAFPSQMSNLSPLSYHGHMANPYLHPYFYKDPRARFIHEEPKPNHSYIGLIAMAILSSRDKKLVLSDIYQWILDNYNYFRTRGPGWRNSIRHNLSLNDCFVKAGRSANGKGHYWAIHPANVDDFQKGDFRRRRAQRRVRKHMGLSVPDDEDDDDSPAQSPVTAHVQQTLQWEADKVIDCTKDDGHTEDQDRLESLKNRSQVLDDRRVALNVSPRSDTCTADVSPAKRPKRLFDMDSLLAPDDNIDKESGNKSADKHPSAIREDDVSPRTVNYNSSDSDNSDHKRHAVDLSLSREMMDGERYAKRAYLSSSVLHNSEQAQSMKLSPGHGSITGKTLQYLPQFMSGLQRGADLQQRGAELQQRGAELQQRVSAFRNAGAYNWASLSGYLSNYQLMALSSQQQSLTQISAIDAEVGARWQQAVNGFSSAQGLQAKEHSSQSPLPQED